MIKSCPYCLSQTHLCPRCEGPVLLRNISLLDSHGKSHSTSLILCDNLECQSYGEFKQQTVYSIVTETCDNCKKELLNASIPDPTGYSGVV